MHIVVIGGGPAGYPAALEAARLGAQVTLVEKSKLGGVCLHCGCIPSKSFLFYAHQFQAAFQAAQLAGPAGIAGAQQLFDARDLAQLQARQQAATQKLTQGIEFLLKKAKVHVVAGSASFVDEHTLNVQTSAGNQTLTFDGAILATGSEAFYPPALEALRGKVYDNTNFFTMERLPKTIAVVGGGVIGCEMADFLHAFGVHVHLIEMQPTLLPQEDPAAARTLSQSFTKRGIVLHTGASVTAARAQAEGFVLTLDDGQQLETEAVLVAIGRRVNLQGLGLEHLGITYTAKGVPVHPQTLQLKNHIYAAGDVTGLLPLAHAASRQGEVAARNLCGVPALYHNERVPRAIYTTPEIAAVGLSAAQLQAQGRTVKTHKSFFLANGRAVAQGQTEGYVQWMSDAQTSQLLGATIVGANAAELIHIPAVALAAGMTVAQVKEAVFAHPTLAETVAEALA